jgi:hypothetical protein
VGNNHAGTYYPVVLDVVPFLKEILDEGTDCARTLVLGVLLDLIDTFEPDADHAMIPRATGERASLAEALRQAVCEMHSSVRRIATSDAVDTQQRHWASELDGVLKACCVQPTGDDQD